MNQELIRLKTKAKVHCINERIENSINDIFAKYLTLEGNAEKQLGKNPIALFFVDPCGMVEWDAVIKKICLRADKKEGTELILNWSWEAIKRNLPNDSRDIILSKIYGIPLSKIENEFKNIVSMEDFLDKYISQLKQYFKFVVEAGVPKDRKLKPKSSSYKKYYLLFCTNNESALSIAGYKIKKIKKKMRGPFADIYNIAKSLMS